MHGQPGLEFKRPTNKGYYLIFRGILILQSNICHMSKIKYEQFNVTLQCYN
jgi:hypothetical protein